MSWLTNLVKGIGKGASKVKKITTRTPNVERAEAKAAVREIKQQRKISNAETKTQLQRYRLQQRADRETAKAAIQKTRADALVPSTGKPVSTEAATAAKSGGIASTIKKGAGTLGMAAASGLAMTGASIAAELAAEKLFNNGDSEPLPYLPDEIDPNQSYNAGFLDGLTSLLGGSDAGSNGLLGDSGYYGDGSASGSSDTDGGGIMDTISDYLPYIIVGIVIIGLIALLSSKKGGKNMARKKSKTGRKTRTHRRSRK